MNGKGLVLENGSRSGVFRPVLSRPKLVDGKLLAPKRWIRIVDTPACLTIIYKVWAGTGYGAADTKVLHRWPPKSCLRRAGVRC